MGTVLIRRSLNPKYSLLPSARSSVFLHPSLRSRYTYVYRLFFATLFCILLSSRDKVLPWWRKEIFWEKRKERRDSIRDLMVDKDWLYLSYNVERFCILIARNFGRFYLYSGMPRFLVELSCILEGEILYRISFFFVILCDNGYFFYIKNFIT